MGMFLAMLLPSVPRFTLIGAALLDIHGLIIPWCVHPIYAPLGFIFPLGHFFERRLGNPRDIHVTSFTPPENRQRGSEQHNSTALYHPIRDPSTTDRERE